MQNKRLQGLLFETVVNSMPDVAVVLDAACNVQFLNRAALEFLGIDAKQAIGKALAEVCPAQILPQVAVLCQRAVNQCEMQEVEVSGLLRDGEPYTTDLQAVPIVEHGALIQILLLSHDVTDRKQIERQREDHLDRLGTLLNVSRDLLQVNDILPLLPGTSQLPAAVITFTLSAATCPAPKRDWTAAMGCCQS